jgi:glycosyltransferase involved in cell wall biosynthesis
MHVAQVSFFVDSSARPPRQLLIDWYSLAYLADAVASSGTRVSVIQACLHEERLSHGGASYYFVRPPDGGCLASGVSFASLVAELQPDVFHVHGLAFAKDVLALRAAAPRTPILLQDHADRVPRFWRRPRFRRALESVDGVVFCARDQAEPFVRARLLRSHIPVFEIPASSSAFAPGEREAARAAAGITGDPAMLWIGHLDANKDPLTVLDGVSRAARELPGLRLWCVFGAAPLRVEVERHIARDPMLTGRVTLLGRVPHEKIETLLRAADIFVLGSHRESTGFALIEAMACGVPPAVTDIPSFRAMTIGGAVGALWKPGDAEGCAAALRSVAAQSGAAQRTAVREHFEAHLSFAAVGRRFTAAYAALGASRA